MLAAMVSAALEGGLSGPELVHVGLETDFLGFRRPEHGGRVMVERVREMLGIADEAADDRSLVNALARAVGSLHPYDPVDALGVPLAALYFTDGDPIRTIAANDRDLDEYGELARMQDVDWTGSLSNGPADPLEPCSGRTQNRHSCTLTRLLPSAMVTRGDFAVRVAPCRVRGPCVPRIGGERTRERRRLQGRDAVPDAGP